MQQNIFGKTLNELYSIADEFRAPKYLAKQLAIWLYKKNISSFDAMTDLAVNYKKKLRENYSIIKYPYLEKLESVDGTKKYLFSTSGENEFIETVLIPENKRQTLCISTQVGCALGCEFCQTGKQGFSRNLNTDEIINQIYSIDEFEKITNIVYMGMGEPLLNTENVLKSIDILTAEWGLKISGKKITVSTVGIIPNLKDFIVNTPCNIAISLHSPFHEERKRIMPIENKYSIKSVIESIKKLNKEVKKKISIEYIVFKNLNHSKKHVNALAKLLNPISCKINLMSNHEIPDIELKSFESKIIEQFAEQLKQKGFNVTIRKSRGKDIKAACGLLTTAKIVMENRK